MAKPTESIVDQQLAAETVKRTASLQDASIDIALRVKEAREFLTWSTNHMKTAWLDWVDMANAASKDMNLFRMSFDRETKTILSSAKDVRDFFSSPDYISSHNRLKEMVVLLDRFSELKQNGTLDAFSDFILKVSCSSPSKS